MSENKSLDDLAKTMLAALACGAISAACLDGSCWFSGGFFGVLFLVLGIVAAMGIRAYLQGDASGGDDQ